ncbi:uncharacterized protein LOC117107430, partial [Anneissia japonica]|uniref:uncharacterized protein LOC117107430 n=1 Tax=Anneissia japonica TaxID=1529436 RepID=UPI0014256F1C
MEGDTSRGIDDSLLSTTHHHQSSQGISEEDFGEILSYMSGWFDRHGYINMLKVLYRDLVTELDKIYAATNAMELFELLRISGHLSPADPTVLYDTIRVTKPFGLEPEIRKLTEKTTFDIRTVVISKITPNRQSLIKFVESLTDNDVKKISKLYCCEQNIDKWGLIVDLEHRGKIFGENVDDFMKQITTHLIIDSNSDPLGLRGTDKDQLLVASALKKAMQLSPGSTDNVCIVNNMVQGNNDTVIGNQFVNCNIKDSSIIVQNTIQLPATQDYDIKTHVLRTQQQLCRDATRFTPANWNTLYEVDIAHMFTDLDLLKKNKKKQDVQPTTLKEVLNIIKSTPACKVLIEGEGGIGKSTLLRYIAYNWSTDESDETFKGKIVFLVNISSVGKDESILDAIVKGIDLETCHLKDSVLIQEFIINSTNDIVLLLDGLDELKDGSESPISYFKKRKMGSSKVILTSRSGKIEEFIKASDIHVKVKGFSKDNIEKYIKKHFEFFKEPALGDSLIRELQPSSIFLIKHREVNSMCKNPMLLLLVCTMWEECQQFPDNKSDLFKEIFRCILNQYIDDKQETYKEKISRYEDIPESFINAMVLLGKCMYKNLKINQLTINKRALEGKEMVTLALKLGFVYKDTPNLKSDFEEIFTAPHKLIVESLVGYYLCKLCQATGLDSECRAKDMKMLLQPLDDNEWKIIRENKHLNIAREFAIGFLGADAGMFLNHWITDNLSTYRSLMAYFEFVKIDHRSAVEETLINHMSKNNLEIMPHIDDICKSLRKFIQHIIPDDIQNEHFIHIMQRLHNIRLGPCSKIDLNTHINFFCKEMTSEEKGRMIAHILIAVPDQNQILEKISETCVDDDIKCLTAECLQLNFKYDISYLNLSNPSTASYIVHLFSNTPQLKYFQCSSNCITGAIMNDMMRECCSRGVKLEFKEIDISDSYLRNIDGSLFVSLLGVASNLQSLSMSNDSSSCKVTGESLYDNFLGYNHELRFDSNYLHDLEISGNTLIKINGISLAALLITSKLKSLTLNNCSLSGAIMNDMMRECCSKGVKLELMQLDISDNNISNIDGSLFVSLLGVASNLQSLSMSNDSSSCKVTGEPRHDHFPGYNHELHFNSNLHKLKISGNTLIKINGISLAALLITSKWTSLTLNNCSLSGAIMNDMMRECCRKGVELELKEIDISDNDLSNIDGSSLASFLVIAPTLSNLEISNCSLSGVIVNDMMRECCGKGVNLSGAIMNDMMRECNSKGVKLDLKKLDISDNDLSNIDGSSLASFLVIAPTLSNLEISNCSLSGVIVNDMMRECCSIGVKLELMQLDISDNDLSNIDGSSLPSFLVIASTLRNLEISNCSLSGVIVNDMMRECCSKGVKLELMQLDISDNDFSNIDGSSLASFFVIAPTLSNLNMSNCSLSGVIVNDMMRECCGKGIKLELLQLNIIDNDLSNINGSLFVSLLGVASNLQSLSMSNDSSSCKFTIGPRYNSYLRRRYNHELRFNSNYLHKLEISGNTLININGISLAALLITSKLTSLTLNNCSLSGAIMNDMMRECCCKGVKLELKEIDISDNDLSNIDGSLFVSLLGITSNLQSLSMSNDSSSSSFLVIAPTLSNLKMSNCSLSGVIVNDMMRECCSKGVKLELKVIDISENNLSNIDGSLFASLLIIAPTLRNLNINNCCLPALTSVVMKVCERIFLSKIKPFVSRYLDPLQFAYRSSRNTEDAIILKLEKIYAHLEGVAKFGHS